MWVIITEYSFHIKGVDLVCLHKDAKILENIIWFLTNCACVSSQFAQEILEANLVKTLKILSVNKLTHV